MIGSIHKTFTLVDYHADHYTQRTRKKENMPDNNKQLGSSLSLDRRTRDMVQLSYTLIYTYIIRFKNEIIDHQ